MLPARSIAMVESWRLERMAPSSAYHQDLSGCMAGRVGQAGLTDAGFQAALQRAAQARDQVITLYNDHALPLLHLPRHEADMAASQDVAAFLKDAATDIVFLGTGGSSLGAQALVQLAGYRVPGCEAALGARLHFFDNLDAATMSMALETLPLKTTKILIVSKSGGTPETMVQALCVLVALEEHGLKPADHCAALTEPGDPAANPLLKLAKQHGLRLLDHDPKVGGRFSVLSNVGLVPALVAGLDPMAVRAGAGEVMQAVLAEAAAAPVEGAAACVALQETAGMTVSVMMPYADRLRLFSAWYAQLWAESLGKQGLGSQPVAAAGPVDQHSQMQLFIDGPQGRLVNLVSPATAGTGPRLPSSLADDPKLSYLAGRCVGDVTSCQQTAAAEVLVRNGRPVRVFALDRIDEFSTGALMMHFMLETIMSGFMMQVDPFDQPAVEQGKVLTRDYLQQMS
jgi:glucose-6-phosphate isomerase